MVKANGYKLTVAHLIASNFFGGPEKQIIEHAKRINHRHYNFILISFIERGQSNEMANAAEESGISLRTLKTDNPFNPNVILRLMAILKEEKVDVICAHGYKSNIVGRIASWFGDIPQISVSRGWTTESPKIRLYERLDKFFLRFADHVVAVSEGQKKKLLKIGINPEKLTMIWNSANLDNSINNAESALKKELGINGDCAIVVSAGRLSPEKNFGGFIEAAKAVAAGYEHIVFAVFGEGALRNELEKKIKLAGLQKRFFLPGYKKNFSDLLNGADIFVLPSLTEGLSNVILEAYALKKPVIATNVGGNPEVVQHGETGFLVNPSDIEKMSQYIVMLSQNPDIRQEMGRKGYEYIKENFNFDIQTKKYEKLYLSMRK